MREIRTYGSEGGKIGSTDLPYPYHTLAVSLAEAAGDGTILPLAWRQMRSASGSA